VQLAAAAATSFSPSTPAVQSPDEAAVFVMKVIDGDTVALSNGKTVRLIGVDTPETVHPTKPVQHFGKEASAFTKRLVEGKTVRLEYDQQHTDKYDRTLAYVYLMDGRMVNAEIIQQGYGFAYVKYPFKYMEEFRSYEREAREAGRGLWTNDGSASVVPASLVSQ
jgi:micrococcal nuclease